MSGAARNEVAKGAEARSTAASGWPLTDALSVILLRLHARIARRYVYRLRKEIAALILIGGGMFIVSAAHFDGSEAIVLSILNLVVVLQFQIGRKDKAFLRSVLVSYRQFLVLENLILMLPSVVALALTGQPGIAVLSATLALPIAFIEWKPGRARPFTIGSVLPATAFEWKRGVRARFVAFAGVLALSIAAFWLPLLAVVAMLYLGYIAAHLQDVCESELIVEACAPRSRFLSSRLRQQLYLYIGAATPALLASILSGSQIPWWIFTAAFSIGGALAVGGVLLKYAHFEQGEERKVDHEIRLLILMAAFLLPPAALIYGLHLYRKATRRIGVV